MLDRVIAFVVLAVSISCKQLSPDPNSANNRPSVTGPAPTVTAVQHIYALSQSLVLQADRGHQSGCRTSNEILVLLTFTEGSYAQATEIGMVKPSERTNMYWPKGAI